MKFALAGVLLLSFVVLLFELRPPLLSIAIAFAYGVLIGALIEGGLLDRKSKHLNPSSDLKAWKDRWKDR